MPGQKPKKQFRLGLVVASVLDQPTESGTPRRRPRGAQTCTEAGRPRPRRDRRPATRQAGGPFLPRLLQLLLLPAAVHLLRRAFAVRAPAPVEHRRGGRLPRGARADRRADPSALAEGPDRDPRRLRLLSGLADELVRTGRGRFRAGSRAERASGGSRGVATGSRGAALRDPRPTREALLVLPVADARFLVAPADGATTTPPRCWPWTSSRPRRPGWGATTRRSRSCERCTRHRSACSVRSTTRPSRRSTTSGSSRNGSAAVRRPSGSTAR